jgi:hypothetical protein
MQTSAEWQAICTIQSEPADSKWNEVKPMTPYRSKSDAHGNTAVLPNVPAQPAANLDLYLATATAELKGYVQLLELGQPLNREARDWMLDQVDFIVETIGDESEELADETRSNLLQLLLAIANLNEQLRQQADSVR